MKKKILVVITCFFSLLTLLLLLFCYWINNGNTETDYREQVVALNEIEHLTKAIGENNSPVEKAKLHEAIEALQQDILDSSKECNMKQQTTFFSLFYELCILFLLLIFGYIYRAILRPFDKLKNYAGEIAKGNFDTALNYERSNYFGEYTWAFDHMRREIVKARACEKEAILNNKTVIATLSHDIKTPIASIRAYAEGLEANLDNSIEKRQRYLTTIMTKCDEVTKLTNDLFLHSISDLDKLKMEFEEVELADFLQTHFNETVNQLTLNKPIPMKTLIVDQKRLEQAIDNLINNSKKYANTSMKLWATIEETTYSIHLRDYGQGIPSEDMPFIMDKFYRGRNAGEQEGSGLGLYIVNYIMKQHGGQLRLTNQKDGLEAILVLPLYKN